jgi:hypothetical protein
MWPRTCISSTAVGWVKSSAACALSRRVSGSFRSGFDVTGAPGRAAGQQRPREGHHHGVVVGVDHTASWRGALGDLVDVVLARQPGADAGELADSRLGGQEADRAGGEIPA